LVCGDIVEEFSDLSELADARSMKSSRRGPPRVRVNGVITTSRVQRISRYCWRSGLTAVALACTPFAFPLALPIVFLTLLFALVGLLLASSDGVPARVGWGSFYALASLPCMIIGGLATVVILAFVDPTSHSYIAHILEHFGYSLAGSK
jgi:hypothetical protein